MKSLYKNLSMKKLIAPLVLFFFFFTLMNNVNSQVGVAPILSLNQINAPQHTSGCVSFAPGIIDGTDVTILNIQKPLFDPWAVDSCLSVSYLWQSTQTGVNFPDPTTWTFIGGATGEDYNPGIITVTTWYRRIAIAQCYLPGPNSASSITSELKLTVNPNPNIYTVMGNTTVCPGITAPVTLSGSQLGIQYTLYRDNIAVVGQNKNGTGSPLIWNVTDNLCNVTHIYKVYAFNALTGCFVFMNDSAVIHFQDITPPTWTSAVGSLNRTLQCNDPVGLAAAQALVPVATDNCGGIVTYTKTLGQFVPGGGPSPFPCPQNGSYTNTWIAKDACLNTSIAFTQIIYIQDTIAPLWSTPIGALNRNVECSDAAGLAAAQLLTPVATDNCSVLISYVKTPGAFVPGPCGLRGTYTNTWIAFDECFNVCILYYQIITITDTTKPVWSTPTSNLDRTLLCSDIPGIIAANALRPVATDNCGTVTYTMTDSTFAPGCGSTGVYTKKWTAKDACLNTTAKFTQTITITDLVAPTWTTAATALNRNVECSDPIALAAAQALVPVATDNCIGTVTLIKTSGVYIPGTACPSRGTYTNTWIARDACFNTSTVFTQVITITDNTAPTWTTSAGTLNRTLECSDAAGLVLAQTLKPIATDNCDTSITYTKTSGIFVRLNGQCPIIGTYTNTWVAKDRCLNTSIVFTQVITIRDTKAPNWITAVGSLNRDIECCNAAGLILAQQLAPIATDSCDGVMYTKISGPFLPGSCGATGTYINTWTAKDSCNNISTVFTQTISIIDTKPPYWVSVAGSLNTSVECSDAAGLTAANLLAPIAADSCVGPITYVKTTGLFVQSGCGKRGSYTNSWIAMDACNNTLTTPFIQIITIIDTTGPSWTTPAGSLDRTLECSNTSGITTAKALSPIAVDNCIGSVTYVLTDNFFTPGCGSSGFWTKKWIARDACLNSSIVFTQIITITDLTAPTWTTTAGSLNTSIECCDTPTLNAAQALFPTATDNCLGNVSYIKTSGAFVHGFCGGTGTYTNTWIAYDACHNTSTVFTQLITITDNLPPIWIFTANQLNTSVECSNSIGLAAANGLKPLAVDNCCTFPQVQYMLKDSTFVPGCGSSGILTKKWVAIDLCNNTSTVFTQVITITDVTPPTWFTQPLAINRTLECYDLIGLAAANALAPMAVDNCPGSITYTKTSGLFIPQGCQGSGTITNSWIAKDACLNTSISFVQTITIIDTTAPHWITLPNALNRTVECSDTAGLIAANLLAPIAEDNCIGNIVYYRKTVGQSVLGSCGLLQVYTNTWVAYDACGNTSTVYTQTITISDITAPTWVTAIGALNRTVSCSDNAGKTAAHALKPIAIDNCTSVTYQLTDSTFVPGCNSTGVYTKKWVAKDVCLNVSVKFTQTITIVDTTKPTISCPPNLIKYCSTLACEVTAVSLGTPTVSDNCTLTASITKVNNHPSTTYPQGITLVTWTATDLCGNTSSCIQTVTVIDTIPPVPTPIPDIVICADSSLTSYTVIGKEFDITCTDNCCLDTVFYTTIGASNAIIPNSLAGYTFNAGITTVIFTAYDCNMNSSTISFTVTINPRPNPIISGPDSVCCNVAETYCDVNGEFGSYSYQWTISGGDIVFGANTSCIQVVWNCNCLIGWIQLTKTNLLTGCKTTTKKFHVVVVPTPVPVIIGNMNVTTNDTSVYSVTCIPGHLYSWTVEGGTIISGQGTCSIVVSWDWDSCISCVGKICVWESTPGFIAQTPFEIPVLNAGCSGTSCIFIHISGPSRIIYGQVTYDNAPMNTPLNGVMLQLVNSSNIVVATTMSKTFADTLNTVLGYYEFNIVPSGIYTLRASTTKPWGGVNATDALRIKLYSIGMITLDPLPLIAADPNKSNSVNSTDALLVQLRTVGLISQFTAGDWVFNGLNVGPYNGIGTINKNIKALATGDVNRSYVPTIGSKAVAYTDLQKEGIKVANKSQEFELPIRVNDVLNLGAVTLDLAFNQNLIDVTSVTSPLKGFEYKISNGKIMIAWANTEPVSLQINDVLLTLKVKAKDELNSSADLISFGDNSEFADESANVVAFSTLKVNSIVTDANAYGINIYPNPFKNSAEIDYNLIESGSVKLVIYNAVGQRMEVLVDEYKTEGNYKYNLNTSDFPSGVYSCEIIINGKSSNFVKTIKLVKTK